MDENEIEHHWPIPTLFICCRFSFAFDATRCDSNHSTIILICLDQKRFHIMTNVFETAVVLYVHKCKKKVFLSNHIPFCTLDAHTHTHTKKKQTNKMNRYEFIWSFVCYTDIKYKLFALVYIALFLCFAVRMRWERSECVRVGFCYVYVHNHTML